MTTFVDTNVLIYLLDSGSTLHDWSVTEFQRSKERGPVIVSDIVYAEFSIGMADKDATDRAIAELACERLRITDQALFNAGRAFKLYKLSGGKKDKMLPDFLIAAQAENESAPLLTANVEGFLQHFSKLQVISPG
jgi:predicted nucleic acid-binding protein